MTDKEMIDEYVKLVLADKRLEAVQLVHDHIKSMSECKFLRAASDLFVATKDRAFKVTISFPYNVDEKLLYPEG